MLSRLSLNARALRPALNATSQSSHRRVLVLSTRSSSSGKEIDHVANWDKANANYYGNERDTKNYPHPVQTEGPPPVRMGLIPETWFKAFYEKTGVTGPYMFGVASLTYLFSQEWIVIEHGFAEFITFWTAFAILAKKLGPALGNYLNSMDSEFTKKRWEEPIAANKAIAQAQIDEITTQIAQQEGQKLMYEAKKENVDLQLEAIYRQRLAEVHQSVKKRLDYQLTVENSQRRFQQEHMANWIVDNVKKGITAQQEKASIAQCIVDLKALGKKQAATA